MRLPVEVVDLKAAAAGQGADKATQQSKTGSLVLVIDDDHAVRDLLSRTLRKEGYRVEVAAGGAEGLQAARSLRPDIITLDVMMPGLDGWAVLNALKGDQSLAEIPVIMVTIVDDKNSGYALGAADYMTKPVTVTRCSPSLRSTWAPRSTPRPAR